ncbi:hypothetical protein D3C76_803910 [compost metagenome]
MKPLYFLIVLFAFIGGCGKENPTPPDATSNTNVLKLTESSSIQLQGKLTKSHKKNNEKGFLVIHEFTYPSVDKIAENDLYGALKRNGYNRKVIKNNHEQFKVHYYKKTFPTIGAIFTTRDEDTQYKTIASIYWQE